MSELHPYVYYALLFVAAIQVVLFILHTSFWTTVCPKLYDELDFIEDYEMHVPKHGPSYFVVTDSFAFNQGLYNLFLGAGILWAVTAAPGLALELYIALFFLALIAIAGIVGGFTLKFWILIVQTVPAVLAAGAIYHYHPDVIAMITDLYELLQKHSVEDLLRVAPNIEG